MLFPVFLFLAWRFGKNGVFWMIVGFAAISLALSEWGWRNEPTANFYLAPTRAWELFAGSIAAFIVQKRGVRGNNLLSLLGLAAIAFAVFAYDETTPFPSLYAVVPVLGVVLLVLHAEKQTLAAKLLSARIFVGIGLISYSAYLWHQPLFAFAKINLVEPPASLFFILIAVSFVMAYLSWRYIETPWRSRQWTTRRTVFLASLGSMAVMMSIGTYGYLSNGFGYRPHMQIYSDLAYDNLQFGYIGCSGRLVSESPILTYCMAEGGIADALVVGDSHADDKFHGIAQSVEGYDWMLLGSSSCPPVMDIRLRSVDGIECTERLKKIFDFMSAKDDLSLVVLSFSHMHPLDELVAADHVKRGFSPDDAIIVDLKGEAADRVSAFYAGLRRTAELLVSRDIDVVISIDIPELTFFPEDCLTEKVGCGFSRRAVLERQKIHRDAIRGIAEQYPGVRVFDPVDVFCEGGSDTCSILKDGRTLYRDSHHLSHFGSMAYGARLAEMIGRQHPDG